VVSSEWCAHLGLADGTEHAVKTTVCIAGLHPWRPCHFALQPSTRISHFIQSSYLYRSSVAAT